MGMWMPTKNGAVYVDGGADGYQVRSYGSGGGGCGKVKKMRINVQLDDGAFMPVKAHADDAGWDLKTPKKCYLMPDNSVVIDTGVHMDIPTGYVGMLKSKSGLNVYYGITCEGTIDSGYTGSIKAKLFNHSNDPYMFEAGDKITQIVFIPIPDVQLVEVDALNADTERGDNGFGSSGR